MTTGVGIFATFAGFIANKLLEPKTAEEVTEEENFEREIMLMLERLHKEMEEQRLRDKEITSRLEKIEQSMNKLSQS